MSAPGGLRLTGVPGLPLVEPGDDLATLVGDALDRAGLVPVDGDVLVVTQKIVSKAEGRVVDLAGVTPGAEARRLAAETQKDPRLVEVILSESRRVVRSRPGLVITEHRRGWVMANAGVDHSNVAGGGSGERVLLLPDDPDASAERLRAALGSRYHAALGVVVSDSAGRAWRRGVIGLALGAAGLPALIDLRGTPDLCGAPLLVTEVALADLVACAAVAVMGEAAEGVPVVLARGLAWDGPARPAADLVRPATEDLFR